MATPKKKVSIQDLSRQKSNTDIVQFGGKSLNKNQLKFNKLIEELKTLADQFEIQKEELPKLHKRFVEIAKPIDKKILLANHKLIQSADVFYREMKLSKNQKEIVKAFIILKIRKLPEVPPVEIQEVFDRYAEVTFKEELEDEKKRMNENLSRMIREMFNLKEDVDLGIDPELSEEENQKRILEKLSEMGIHPHSRNSQETEDPFSPQDRPKTEKQLVKERMEQLKKEKEDELRKKSFKTIYTELMKAFHPDKETDIERKAEKEEISKKITVAYGNQDFFTLLKLEAEFLTRQEGRFQSLPEDQLSYYLKMVTTQKNELKAQLSQLQEQFGGVYHNVFKTKKNPESFFRAYKDEMSREEQRILSNSRLILLVEPALKKDIVSVMEEELMLNGFDDYLDEYFDDF